MLETEKKFVRNIIVGVLIFIGIILFFGSFGTVGASERGVKTRLGKVMGIVDQGLYFKMPFIDDVTKISTKTQTVVYEKENPLTSASKDLQDVTIATVVNYHIDPTKVVEIFVDYGTLEAFEEKVIRPEVRATVKTVASQYAAEELVTKRAEFSELASVRLNEQLVSKNVIIENTNITNIQFSPSFTAAIENKVTAVQNAEAAKNKLAQIEFEAKQTEVTAIAEANALEIKSAALKAQGGAEYVKLQAIAKWNGVLPAQMIPNAAVPFIDLK